MNKLAFLLYLKGEITMEPKKLHLKRRFAIQATPLGKLFQYLNDIITDRTVEYHYDKEGTITVVNRQTVQPHIKTQKFNIYYHEETQLFTIMIILFFDVLKYPIPHKPISVTTELRHAMNSDHDIAQLAHLIHYYMDTNNIPTL